MEGLREYQTEELSVWSVNRLCAWVRSIGHQGGWREDYSQGFVEHEIDGRCLRDLTSDLLRELGIAKIGHRLTILREIKKLSDSMADPTPTVLPTPNSNQGTHAYNVPQQAYQLPIYMPQQSNYNGNCYATTMQMQQEHQPQHVEQPVTNGRSYQAPQEEAAQLQYVEPKNALMTQETSEVMTKGAAQEPEENIVQEHRMVQQQQDIYEEDEFPNAENLEPPTTDNMMVPQNDIAPQIQQAVEHPKQQCIEEEHSASTEKGSVQQFPAKQEYVQKEIVAEANNSGGHVQSRPSAWGSNNKLRMAPNTATPSKLLIQTNRHSKMSSRTPPQDKRYNRPSEVKQDEQYSPPPQMGDILKGAVKRVVAGLGAFVDMNGPDDALLTNKEGAISFRVEVNKSYWVMVKKVVDHNPSGKGRRIHLTSFVPGVMVHGTIAHPHPVSGARQIGFFVNIGWWKPGLLLLKRMRDKNKKKHQQLNALFVLSHKLKVLRNNQSTAELDLTEIEPQEWKPEDVFCWLESFYGPGERLPENIPPLNGKDIFSLTPQVLDQYGLCDPQKKERILLSVKMMTEQRTYLSQRTRKQYTNSAPNQMQKRSEIPSIPTGDSHFPALGNKGRRR